MARQIRGILGGEDQGGPISFYSQEELLDYVNRLIDNSEFRKEEGERMKSMLQTEGAFNLALGKILNDDFPHPKVSSQSIDYYYRTGIYLDNQNNFEFNIINPLLKRYGVLTFYYFPFLFTVVTKQKKYVVNQIFTAMEKYILNNLQSYRSYVLKK
ncbi:MAG: hypothetical protein LIO65_04320 [Odoribacter sp.]|nr:hypothetical protein [Odoribacter sp.]